MWRAGRAQSCSRLRPRLAARLVYAISFIKPLEVAALIARTTLPNVPATARRQASRSVTSKIINHVRHSVEVPGIAAGSIATQVVKLCPCRYRPADQLIGDPMGIRSPICAISLAAHGHLTIASSALDPLPNPTAAVFIDRVSRMKAVSHRLRLAARSLSCRLTH